MSISKALEKFDEKFPFWSINPKHDKWAILANRKNIKQFLITTLKEAMEEVKPKEVVEGMNWAIGFNQAIKELQQNIKNYFNS